jgi:hypothetical protein
LKKQIINDCKASFLFWVENSILDEGRAYTNYTSRLFYNKDNRLGANYVSYSSPFKQWVYDKGVSGAFVCSGISGSLNLSNGQSGLMIDYENGRVILPASFGTGLNISGSYAFKDFNVYISNETEEKLLTSSKFYLNSRYDRNATGAIAPYDIVTPAIFFNALSKEDSPFALGGEKQTKISMSTVIFSETMDNLDAAISFLTDKSEKSFPQVNQSIDPLNPFGGIKTGVYPNGYNYKDIKNQNFTPGNLFYVESARGSKLSDNFKTNDKNFVGIVDFEITRERYT